MRKWSSRQPRIYIGKFLLGAPVERDASAETDAPVCQFSTSRSGVADDILNVRGLAFEKEPPDEELKRAMAHIDELLADPVKFDKWLDKVLAARRKKTRSYRRSR